MVVCPVCAHENRQAARFCDSCGNPLRTDAPAVFQERKVVTALFCDLVGFTATSEGADPEDVDRMLTAYFVMARAQIEAYGGVVEKFIGDAVLGVFGVPAAHEDDPERAVRAALRIAEGAADLKTIAGAPLRLRVGINTGETLVRLGVSPGSGERFLAGDAINTASRIQSVAPEMGVAAGLSTWESTKWVFDYVELPPAVLKGKSEPVRVFHARAPLARVERDVARAGAVPFVGRTADVALLRGLFEKVVASRSCGMVTIVGEPGLGKSRLVAELYASVDARPDLVSWRQGRCLPYGKGITFWALGEIVKAHAGILDSDSADVAGPKLDAVLPEGDERPWLRQRLLPLLGIEAGRAASQEESFTAWRRFLEHIATDRPAVLVFEDLHWADAELLAFLEHVASRADSVPLMLVGTARPELFERHPTFFAAVPPAKRINLRPLTEDETSQLVTALLGAVMPGDLAGPVLERAEGNPLYAEELVRLLRDRDLLVGRDGGLALRPGATVPLPDSISALIAARLDTLSPEGKSILADAAVIGKVFWAGAVAAMGERNLDFVLESLIELSRKDLVRPAPSSSMADDTEYTFWHVLTRDVAYAALPRASRAARHVAAARWIEGRAGDRVEDQADILAHHYATAVELARASGDADRAAELEPPALRFLSLAGDRALRLDAAGALPILERALALEPPGHPERPRVLLRFGEAAHLASRFRESISALEEAAAAFGEQGDVRGATRARLLLALPLGRIDYPRVSVVVGEALAAVEPLGPSVDLVAALAEAAAWEALGNRNETATELAERALAMARDLGLPPPARALGYRAMARCAAGDPGGLDDYREAIVIAGEAGQGREGAVLRANLSSDLFGFEGALAATRTATEAIEYSQARGLSEMVSSIRASTMFNAFALGELEEALTVIRELASQFESSGAVVTLVWCRSVEAQIQVLRGQAPLTRPWLDWLESAARATGDPQTLAQGLESAALAHAKLGAPEAAVRLLEEAHVFPGVVEDSNHLVFTPAVVRIALELGGPALAERLLEGIDPIRPHAAHVLATANAALLEARGDFTTAVDAYGDAVARWQQFGMVSEQAFALLGQGRCLDRLGRVAEAQPLVAAAGAIFESLRAAPHLAEADSLLVELKTRRA
jgi:class 3 adenylate cyclase/tetratricopeptide (TPR) repeat protein